MPISTPRPSPWWDTVHHSLPLPLFFILPRLWKQDEKVLAYSKVMAGELAPTLFYSSLQVIQESQN